MTLNQKLLALAAGLALCTAQTAFAQHGDHDHGRQKEEKAKPQFKGDPYILETDAVSGEKLGPIEKQVVIDYEGRELRFANEENVKTFRADPAKYLAKVDEAMVKQQLPFYPLEMCPVSGKKLGEMGESMNLIYKNRLVRFCCPDCKAEFLKDPSKYIAKLDAAVVAAQSKKYAAKTCVVSDETFGGEMGEPVDYVIGNRLVRLCCDGCIKKLRKDPLKFLAMIDSAKGTEHGHDGKGKEDGHKHDDHNH
jgi:YHS domain-containing protein